MSGIVSGAGELSSALSGLNSQIAKQLRSAIVKATLLVHRESVNNAPRSPTMAQIQATRKTNRRGKKNPRATSRAKPGGLRRSIEWNVDGTEGEVFVAANSEAGTYAGKMHDERYITWRNLGVGSIALGGRVRDKFIERAVDDNQKAVTDRISRALKGLNL